MWKRIKESQGASLFWVGILVSLGLLLGSLWLVWVYQQDRVLAQRHLHYELKQAARLGLDDAQLQLINQEDWTGVLSVPDMRIGEVSLSYRVEMLGADQIRIEVLAKSDEQSFLSKRRVFRSDTQQRLVQISSDGVVYEPQTGVLTGLDLLASSSGVSLQGIKVVTDSPLGNIASLQVADQVLDQGPYDFSSILTLVPLEMLAGTPLSFQLQLTSHVPGRYLQIYFYFSDASSASVGLAL
ncbi:MAG: hypothetical protein CL521_02940 [Actinobacteria bacterium]|nr:hypothetical protein [Actinomycetota bacterium]